VRIVLMGPPGAGKGTQAKRLAEAFGMAHLSSGDIFRAERACGSPLGKEMARYMDDGRLVPDGIVVGIMARAITAAPGGLLLDGFPRTVPQAQSLDKQLQQVGKPLDAVLVITVDDDEIVERVAGRRSCPKCGKAYHVKFLRPKAEGLCDACGVKLVQREDDTEKVVRQRLEAYRRQTEPVIAYYRARNGVKLVEADGAPPPEEVTAALAKALKGLSKRT